MEGSEENAHTTDSSAPAQPVKMARLKWRLADPSADPLANEGPYVDGNRPGASVAPQPSGANSRLVGYSPWKPLDEVLKDAAQLDSLSASARWYTYEIQMKDDA